MTQPPPVDGNPSAQLTSLAPSGGPVPRFGLGLMGRTRAWIVALMLLALAAALLAHQALERLQAGLQGVVAQELEQLMDAVRLVQQSEALISQSLTLAQSQTQEERRRLWVDQQDRLDWIRKMTRQVASRGHADPHLLTRVESAQAQLADGVTALDALVHQRLRLLDGGRRPDTASQAQLNELEQRITRTTQRNRERGNELSMLMGYFSADTRARLRERVDHLSEQVRRQQNGLWALTALTVVLMVVLGAYLQRTVVRRIVGLQRAVSLDPVDTHALAVGGHDEITRLSQTVQQYVSRIQANEQRLQRANQDLAYLAEHDPLTRLANRRHFDAAARRMLVALHSPLAVVVLDIDHFKAVNDRHGHDLGDQALVHVAQCLSEVLRERDVLARFGGEEFVALLPVTGLEAALDVCERMRDNLASKAVPGLGARPLQLTVSAGVALITGLPLDKDSTSTALMQTALQAADGALYQAKAGGRNRVCSASVPVHAALHVSLDADFGPPLPADLPPRSPS